MIYGYNDGVLLYFGKSLHWTHDFPLFIKYELEYSLIDYGTLKIDHDYINYVIESWYFSI